MNYQLSINIDQAGLNTIYAAGQTVTLVKSVTNFPGSSGNLPVAWISFQPFEQNIISWVENFSVYASTTQLQAGATISMSSTDPAQTGLLYTFQNGSFQSGPGTSPSTFNVLNNQTPGNFNFGLAQSATINGVSVSAPISAIPVPYNETATFTPIETISVFLSSSANNGVVLSQVAGNACVVTLTSQNPTGTLSFNDANNTFYVSNSAMLSQKDLVSKRLKIA